MEVRESCRKVPYLRLAVASARADGRANKSRGLDTYRRATLGSLLRGKKELCVTNRGT